MLRRIRLKNFQRHKKLDIRIDEKLTTIVGQTGAGKSAIIRAIQWVCFNKPAGMGFIHKRKAEAIVRLDFDGFSITRIRSKRRNEYQVARDGEVTKLVSFKSEPPELVQELLNLNGVNLQMQFDSPFWLGQSEMQVAKLLNEVVNLAKLDRGREQVTSKMHSLKSSIKVRETSIDRMTNSLDGYLGLDETLADIEEADRLLKEIESSPVDELESIIEDIDEAEAQLERDRGSLKLYKKLKPLVDEMQDIVKLGEAIEELSGINSKLALSEMNVEIQAAELKRVQKELSKFKRCPICQSPR